ncbi:MAG: hydroxyacid dehydrogenase [Candidatus Nomurabacteria bacterium]|jgi:D-lactate dehydrogenase|nr:hydroxyacid dehydrogenase [Candidatus Nomurabacteria bacterium]
MQKVGFIGLDAEEKTYFEEKLGGQFRLLFYPTPVDADKLDPEIEVLSVFTNTKVDEALLNKLPRLKLIACRSTGYDNIDADAVRARGIAVANTPGYGSSSVAEYTFALILTLSRKLPGILHQTYSSEPNRRAERGFDLYGKTIGIIGLGNIGKGVAQIAYGLGMRILAFDTRVDEKIAGWLKIEYVDDLDFLLAQSDIVTLHIPYTPLNHHLININKLARMKSNAIVINTARGDLIDTVALVKALDRGDIAGAALDVVEDEYLLDPDDLIDLAASQDRAAKATIRHALALLALERMPNVIVTNHNAYNTVEALDNIHRLTVENIVGFCAGVRVNLV